MLYVFMMDDKLLVQEWVGFMQNHNAADQQEEKT
jgi:hypothetical protein